MTHSFSTRLLQLLRNTRGSVTIMVGAAVFLMIMCIGAAIDMAREETLQTRLQTALDAAGMAAATTSDTVNVQTQAQKYFNANFQAGYLGSNPEGIQITATNTSGVITLTATTPQNTTFLAAVGIPHVTVSAAAKVSAGSTVSCTTEECIYIAGPFGIGRLDANGNWMDCSSDLSRANFAGGLFRWANSMTTDSAGNIIFLDNIGYTVTSGIYTWRFPLIRKYKADGVTEDTSFTPIDPGFMASINGGTFPSGYTTVAALDSIALDSQDNIWTATQIDALYNNGFVQQYSPNGIKISKFTASGKGRYPWSMAIDSANSIWLISTDTVPTSPAGGANNVNAIDYSSYLKNPINSSGPWGNGNERFAVSSLSRIPVFYVQKYNTSGQLLTEWALPHTACTINTTVSGCLVPSALAVTIGSNNSPEVYVTNMFGQVQKFNGTNGNLIASLGSLPLVTIDSSAGYPRVSFISNIAVDKSGNIFVATMPEFSSGNIIYKISPDGTQTTRIASGYAMPSGGLMVNYKGAASTPHSCTNAGAAYISQ